MRPLKYFLLYTYGISLTMLLTNAFSWLIIGPPPVPLGIEATLEDTNEVLVPFNLTWDSNFNLEHAITSYTIIPESTRSAEGRSLVTCPHSCYPDDSCQCRGLARGDTVTILISAVNCGTQEGNARRITVASCMLKVTGAEPRLQRQALGLVAIRGEGCLGAYICIFRIAWRIFDSQTTSFKKPS